MTGFAVLGSAFRCKFKHLLVDFPKLSSREIYCTEQGIYSAIRESCVRTETSSEIGLRIRYGEAFWRAHHEAWQQQSALNQWEYCEAR